MARASLIACAALACVLAGGGPRAAGADEPGPRVLFDAAVEARAPRGEGVVVNLSGAAGRPAAVVAVGTGVAYARIALTGLDVDVQPYAHLDLELRHVDGEAQALTLELFDGANRRATQRLAPPTKEWETRRLALGDLRVDPGFDPAKVASLQLYWKEPALETLALAKLTLVAGPGGWRHAPEKEAAQVFGPQRAALVKHEATAHFELYSDDGRALKSVGAALEKDTEACVGVLQGSLEALSGLKIPVYAFKQASDFQDYCVRVLGSSKETARSTTSAGSDRGLVFHVKAVDDPQLRHRLGKAVFSYLYGDGGGAWLQDGAGELCTRRLMNRPVAKEFAPRVKTGDHWTLEDLLRAQSLHGGERRDQSFDYRPIYLHAAAVVEYLLREAPPAAPGSPEAPSARVTARLKALGSISAVGIQRLEALPAALGLSIADLELAFHAWVLKAK